LPMIMTSVVWAAGSVPNRAVLPRGATTELRDGYNDGRLSGRRGWISDPFHSGCGTLRFQRGLPLGLEHGYVASFEDQRRAPLMVPSR
jgi:hypothetical protein